jgi:hypothetical protein
VKCDQRIVFDVEEVFAVSALPLSLSKTPSSTKLSKWHLPVCHCIRLLYRIAI